MKIKLRAHITFNIQITQKNKIIENIQQFHNPFSFLLEQVPQF